MPGALPEMNPMVFWIASAVGPAVAYLFGATPTGYLAGRLLKGIDIREHGSKSTGATNVLRTLGKWPALVVIVVDLLKAWRRSSSPAGFILGSIDCRRSRRRRGSICRPFCPGPFVCPVLPPWSGTAARSG